MRSTAAWMPPARRSFAAWASKLPSVGSSAPTARLSVRPHEPESERCERSSCAWLSASGCKSCRPKSQRLLWQTAIRECGLGAHKGKAFSEAIRTARSTLRLRGMSAKDEERSALQALDKWKAGRGQELVNNFLGGLGNGLGDNLAEFFVAEPGNKVFTLHFAPATAATIASFVGYVAADSKSNLKHALKEYWEQLHTPVLEAESKPLAPSVDKPNAKPCLTVGMCICCPLGRKLKQLVYKFYKVFKLRLCRVPVLQRSGQGHRHCRRCRSPGGGGSRCRGVVSHRLVVLVAAKGYLRKHEARPGGES